jgi:hypothetical protein
MSYLNLFRGPRAKFRVITIILSLIAATAFVKGARTYSSGSQPEESRATSSTITGMADQNKKVKRVVETELITLKPAGFEPSEIARPAGEFILMVENRSGQPADLRVSRESGQHLHEVESSREEPDWNELMDLHPGRYVLTEANHPEWVCQIIITAR